MREAKEEEDEEESRNHPRLMIQKFLSDEECRELEFIHKSCSTVGYRPNVFSTTLSHLAATNSHHLIIPFVPIRERLKEKAEEFFDCQFELFVEFTGLISWIKGASIGWHSDDNRPYLKQRDFAAVCYLNSHGIDFKGGLFHFQDGEPTTIVPSCGDVVMYTADTRNIHSVDEITDGERLTLTLWFSRDSSHDEDAKLVSILSQSLLDNDFPDSCLPFPASTNMYWFSPNQESNLQTGFDICCARLHILGYDVHGSQDKISCSDSSELLIKPLRVARGNQLFDHEFANILHALQVVQFYFWKGTELHASHISADNYKVVELSQIQLQEISCLKSVYLTDHELAETILSSPTCNKNKQQKLFDWACFAGAAASWEEYVRKLHKEMLGSFPHWKTQQSIFKVSGTCL